MLKTVKDTEKQLTYLTRVTLTLFSYGMPSSTSKAALMGRKQTKPVRACVSLDEIDCGDQMSSPES
jgi:hypothetical protein